MSRSPRSMFHGSGHLSLNRSESSREAKDMKQVPLSCADGMDDDYFLTQDTASSCSDISLGISDMSLDLDENEEAKTNRMLRVTVFFSLGLILACFHQKAQQWIARLTLHLARYNSPFMNNLVEKCRHLEVVFRYYAPPFWSDLFVRLDHFVPGMFIIMSLLACIGLTVYLILKSKMRCARRISDEPVILEENDKVYCANRMTPAMFADKGPTIQAVVQLLASPEFKRFAEKRFKGGPSPVDIHLDGQNVDVNSCSKN